jgi:hypothetical protein
MSVIPAATGRVIRIVGVEKAGSIQVGADGKNEKASIKEWKVGLGLDIDF